MLDLKKLQLPLYWLVSQMEWWFCNESISEQKVSETL